MPVLPRKADYQAPIVMRKGDDAENKHQKEDHLPSGGLADGTPERCGWSPAFAEPHDHP